VPITVYVVLATGVAITFGPLVVFNVAPGDQVYVFAPATVRLTELPKQTEEGFGVTVSGGVAKFAGKLILTVPLQTVTVFFAFCI